MNIMTQAFTNAIANNPNNFKLGADQRIGDRDMNPLEIAQQEANKAADAAADVEPLLPNPMDLIDRLHKLAPVYAERAHSGLCNTLGWYVVNALTWQHRMLNKRPVTESTIDWRNRMGADEDVAEASAETLGETAAHDPMPRINSLAFTAAYKYLALQLNPKPADNTRFKAPDPINIFNAQQNMLNQDTVEEAYNVMAADKIRNTDFGKLVGSITTNREAEFQARQAVRLRADLDYVLGEIAMTTPEAMDNTLWTTVPEHIQYRIIFAINRQVIEAYINEMRKPVDERYSEDELSDFGIELTKELKYAARDPIVKRAFDEGILDATKYTVA